MYSANGTGCRLTYIWSRSGPVTGLPEEPGVADLARRRRRAAPRRPGSARRSRRRPRRCGARRPGCAAGRCRWSSPATPPGRAAAAAPAATSAASASGGVDVVVEHGPALGVEVQAEPRHVALHDRDGDRAGAAGRGDRRTSSRPGDQQRAAPAAAGRRAATAARPAARRHGSATSSPPAAATANVTSGAPPSAASRSSGESPWLNASRPHGNPPNGARSRSASCATHSSPVTSGHSASASGRPAATARRRPAPSSAEVARPAATDSSSHGSQPACRLVQSSSGTKNTSPASRPSPSAGPQPPPVHGRGEQRHPDRGEPPQAVRRERQQQRQRRRAAAIGTATHSRSGRRARRPGGAGRRRAAGGCSVMSTRGRLPGSGHDHIAADQRRRAGRETESGRGPRAAPRCSQALPRPVRQDGITRDLRTDRDASWLPPSGRCLLAPLHPLTHTGSATGPRRPADPHPLDLACARAPGQGRRRGQRAKERSEQQPLPVVGLKDGTCRPPAVLSTGRSPRLRRVAFLGVSCRPYPTRLQVRAQQAGRRRPDGRRRAARPAASTYSAVDHRRAAARGSRPAARRVGQHRGQDAARAAGACRSTPPEPTTSRTSRRSRPPGAAAGPAPATWPRACRRSATVGGRRGQPDAGSAVRAPAPPASGLGAGSRLGGGRRQHPGALHRHPRSPSTVRARHSVPGDVPARPGSRSASGSSAEYTSVVAPPTSTTSSAGAGAVGEQLHPGRAPRPGWRPAPATRTAARGTAACRRSRGAGTPRGSPPAPGPGRARRCAAARCRSTVTGTPAAGQQRGQPRRGRRRCRPPPPAPASRARGQPARVVQQHVGVAAVGAADQQHHVRSGRAQRRRRRRASSRPAATCTTRAPADSADPVPGLAR